MTLATKHVMIIACVPCQQICQVWYRAPYQHSVSTYCQGTRLLKLGPLLFISQYPSWGHLLLNALIFRYRPASFASSSFNTSFFRHLSKRFYLHSWLLSSWAMVHDCFFLISSIKLPNKAFNISRCAVASSAVMRSALLLTFQPHARKSLSVPSIVSIRHLIDNSYILLCSCSHSQHDFNVILCFEN